MPADWPKWSLAVDLDRCTGCQACVVACQAENNVSLNTEDIVTSRRTIAWIRIERYWEGEYPNIKARFLPLMCQHCGNAPCEPVCPMYATYHNADGLNVQIYNRCVGTRYCANNCPYHARYFNFWEREWPKPLNEQLNPDVTVRSKGIMEKCTLCVHRIRRTTRQARREGRQVIDGELQTACAQACPSDALIFGIVSDPNSRVAKAAADPRHYSLMEDIGTEPNIIYLKKVDPYAEEEPMEAHGAAAPAGAAQGGTSGAH
jgi:molybdopterin-containing oxidoreductase family iron-sulfur binding subunit